MFPRLRLVEPAFSPPAIAPADRAADDGALAARALAGDDQAWGALIERHGHRVVVSLLARGLPMDEARELAQEAWVRLYEQHRKGKLERLELPGLAIVQAGFLAGKAERRARLARRLGFLWGGKPRREDAAPAAEEAAASGLSLETQLDARKNLAVLQRALATCPPRSVRVFERVYQHPELTYAQVAAAEGLSVQRVKQIVCEVRAHLRAALDEETVP